MWIYKLFADGYVPHDSHFEKRAMQHNAELKKLQEYESSGNDVSKIPYGIDKLYGCEVCDLDTERPGKAFYTMCTLCRTRRVYDLLYVKYINDITLYDILINKLQTSWR